MHSVSIIAYVGEEYDIEPLVDSLLKQRELDNSLKLQVIFTGEIGRDILYDEEWLAKYPFEIKCVEADKENIAKCYNEALKYAEGEYISFVDSDSMYSKGVAKRLREVLELEDIEESVRDCICIRPEFMRPNGDVMPYKTWPNKGNARDVSNNTKELNLCLYSYFVKRTLCEQISFNEEFPAESRQLFIIELMQRTTKYFGCKIINIRYRHALEDDRSFFVQQHKKEWYNDTLKGCYIPLLETLSREKKLTPELEAGIMYLTYMRFSSNLDEADKHVLDDNEVEELYRLTYDIAGYMSYDTIIQKNSLNKVTLPVWFIWDVIQKKSELAGHKAELIFAGGNYIYNVEEEKKDEESIRCQYKLIGLQQREIRIYSINYRDNSLVIDFALPYFPESMLDMFSAKCNGVEVVSTSIYNIKKCFGKVVARGKMYQATVPLKEAPDNQKCNFSVETLGRSYKLPLVFVKPAARLNETIREAYWLFDNNKCLVYNARSNELIIRVVTRDELAVMEANYCLAIKHDPTLKDKQIKKLLNMRKKYWENFDLQAQERPIWITFDKLYKAGDNGEYFYHYVRENHPEIDIYYIIKDTAADWERLKGDPHVVLYGSEKAKLLSLKASVIAATHVNIMIYCGFTEVWEKKYLRNLFNAQVACIQHGLTVQDIAVYQNRLYDNTLLYCCASKYEIENILKPVYGYDESQAKLNGLARYDGLVNNDQKQILITPTWRRDIVNGGVACDMKSYNVYFKNSEYYKIYNSLINDERLMECARECGYKIIYLLHPAMSAQIDDYDKNDYVDIIAATGDMSYEKVLTESSLMVTDYSGVQFDFAYMRKPILYYHPSKLPPHYDESSSFVYETMGFGPIIDEHDELIAQLCAYMKNDCQTEEEYKKRADDFFAFDDTRNCERIFEEMLKFSNENMSDTVLEMEDKFDIFELGYKTAKKTTVPEPAVEKVVEQKEVKKRSSMLHKIKRLVRR